MEADKTPDCPMHEALMSYLYDEATPEEFGRVENHLAECAACKQELAAFGQVRGLLQQWQVDDLPFVRIATPGERDSRHSVLEAFRNLLSVTPAWGKAFGAVTLALLVLAVLGTEVNVGREGVSIKANLFRWNNAPQVAGRAAVGGDEARLEEIRAELKGVVNSMIADNERQQREEMRARLVSLESQIHTAREADLAKLAARIQEQRARLKSLERDIDRREGTALSDILFSEVAPDPSGRRAPERGGD
ncbi:MAG TPA: zf-HC2 domain-containing protein [Blastocatellia bacterium]|nr:zf-HC2 domain-containing protein [Blastocatellia bacterium]